MDRHSSIWRRKAVVKDGANTLRGSGRVGHKAFCGVLAWSPGFGLPKPVNPPVTLFLKLIQVGFMSLATSAVLIIQRPNTLIV